MTQSGCNYSTRLFGAEASSMRRVAMFLVLAAGLAAGESRAAEIAGAVDAQTILDRLEAQDTEIARLRARLADFEEFGPASIETVSLPAPAGSTANAAGEATIQPQSASFSVDRFDDVVHRLESLEQAGKKKVDSEKKGDDGWKDLSGEKWTVKIIGHLQGDYINWANADPAIHPPPIGSVTQDYFEFRRVRIGAEGSGYGVFDFRLLLDAEPEADSENGITGPFVAIKDAYLGIHETPIGYVRFGNFYVPYSIEQVTSDAQNTFMERSIPTQDIFTGDREVGMAVYNISDDKNFTWTFGAFFDSISEGLKQRVDDNQGIRLSGRLTWLPYYDEPSNGRYLFHTGIGVLYTDDQDGKVRFRARPQIHEGPFLIDSGVLNASSTTSGNVELATILGPFSVQSELFLTSVNLDNGGPTTLPGAYVYASYFLTGENRQYEREGNHGAHFGRVTPYTNVFWIPGCHGCGAWEVKARMSYLDLDNVNAGRYHDLTLGFNWYWTDRIRMMFDWIHPITSANTTFGKTQSDILATRLEYNF